MKPAILCRALALALLSSSSGAADSYKETILHDDPFAYYRLDERNVAQPVADERGNHPGTFQNDPALAVPGALANEPQSRAVTFRRAQAQYAWLTNFGQFGSRMTNGCTAEYWLKTGNATDHQTIFGVANGPGYINDFLADIAYNGTRNRLRLYIRDNRWNRYEVNFQAGGQNANIFDNAWHHIVHVYAPKAAELEDRVVFYIDGVRQKVAVLHKGNAPVFANFNHPLTLGAMDLRGKQPDHLDGSLDEVAFYTTPLSAEQVKRHHAVATGNLVASAGGPATLARSEGAPSPP
jgi:hypothetical protein